MRAIEISEKCWDGYQKKGMKTMFGKQYPNCVKKSKTKKEEVEYVDESEYWGGPPKAKPALQRPPNVSKNQWKKQETARKEAEAKAKPLTEGSA